MLGGKSNGRAVAHPRTCEPVLPIRQPSAAEAAEDRRNVAIRVRPVAC
jgi:hypothetical protein